MFGPRRLSVLGRTSLGVSGSWWTVLLACVAAAAPCSAAPVLLAFFRTASASALEGDRVSELWLGSARDSQSKAALHTDACMSSASAEFERGLYLSPTFSFKVTPQALAIFLRAAFRSRPLESRSVIAAARISSPRVSSLPAASSFAMTSSRDILCPTAVETCSEAPTPDSAADVGILCALFPNVGHRNAKQVNVNEYGHSACMQIAERNLHSTLWYGMSRGTCQLHTARNRLVSARAI